MSQNDDFKPTGDCYRAAAIYLIDKYFLEWEMNENLRLVHGRPTLQRPPHCKYGHAWIEIDKSVAYDVEKDRTIPIKLFYEAGQIDPEECFYYTFEEMKQKLNQFKHYGPWEGEDACPPVSEED